VQADPAQFGIGEHAEGDESVARRPGAACQVVPNDPEVIERDVGELRATRTIAQRPDVGRSRLEALIHDDIAALIKLDSAETSVQFVCIRRPSCGDQEIGSLDRLLAGRHLRPYLYRLPRSSADLSDVR